MVVNKKKKCRNCGCLFIPDHRNRNRQKYCSKPACRKASKAASQQRWLHKPENQDYFRGPENVQRVQRWRAAHPGYEPPKRVKQSGTLQDPLTTQPTKIINDIGKQALQDPLSLQPAVIIGLIANFTGVTLQDDIVNAIGRLRQLGQDILNHPTQITGGNHGIEVTHHQGSHPHRSKTVQLDRSPSGPRSAH